MPRFLLPILISLLLAGAAQAEEKRLRIVSYNLWGIPRTSPARSARFPLIPKAVHALKPDVVLFQELWLPEDSRQIQAAMRDLGYRFLARPGEGLFSSGLLIASRHKILTTSFRHYSLGGFAHELWHGDFYGGKGVLRVRIETALGPVDIADTHLHARYGDPFYIPTQVSQALELSAALAAADGVPLILGGDLNARAGELPFRVLKSAAGLRGAHSKMGIDAVLLRDGRDLKLRADQFRYALTKPRPLRDGRQGRLSDHRAAVADISLLPGNGVELPSGRLDANLIEEARSLFAREISASQARGALFFLAAFLAATLAALAIRRRQKLSAEPRDRARRRAFLAAVSVVFLALAFLLLRGVEEVAYRRGIARAISALDSHAGRKP